LLRPGGTFLFGDYRRSTKMPRLHRSLTSLPLSVKVLSDITPGIVRGLESNSVHKRRLIDRHAPFGLRGVARKFAGLSKGRDTELDNFRFGRKSYIMAVLEKPA
jgi:fatty-acid O-methyltransferase